MDVGFSLGCFRPISHERTSLSSGETGSCHNSKGVQRLRFTSFEGVSACRLKAGEPIREMAVKRNMKMKFSTLCAAAAATLTLAACSGMGLERTKGMSPTGSAFDKAMFSDYLALSRMEYNEGDYRNSDFFAKKAKSAAEGTTVEPVELSERTIPASETHQLSSARDRLMAALNGGARARMPELSAHAQANFECWMEEAEEGKQANHLAECRSKFFDDLAKIEAKPAVAAMPAPMPTPKPETIAIYFGFNKAYVNRQGEREVDQAVARIKALHAKEVILKGHADRSGAAGYNMKLSERRVAAVREAIEKSGVNVSFSDSAVGESQPPVPTADGVRLRGNRVVTVTIIPGRAPMPEPKTEMPKMPGHGA